MTKTIFHKTVVKDLNQVDIQASKRLYLASFSEDSVEFVDLIYNTILKKALYYAVLVENEIAFQAFALPKRLFVDHTEQKQKAYLIFAVSTDSKFQRQGFMKQALDEFIKDCLLHTDYLFIQAYSWNYYKSFDFCNATSNLTYQLKPSHYLKSQPYYQPYEKINYDAINDIRIAYIKKMKLHNFIYETNKENKKTLKLHQALKYEIKQNQFAFIIRNKITNEIVDFAYKDFKYFVGLISYFKDVTIKSPCFLDNRFFNKLNIPPFLTKVYDPSGEKKNKQEIEFPVYFYHYF